jgi:hypothetical protein
VAALSHVILHLTLCNAALQTTPKAPVAVRVKLSDRTGAQTFAQTYQIQPEDVGEPVVEFDNARGAFKLQVDVPQYHCTGTQFLVFMPDHVRKIAVPLYDQGQEPPLPSVPMVLYGDAPLSFVYVKPTFVLFDKSVECKKPVDDPLPAKIVTEYDQNGYYVWLYPDPSMESHQPVTLALRMRTATGMYHYLRIPRFHPQIMQGWPQIVQLPITEEDVDGVATDPTDVLLCPSFRSTTAG